MSAEHTLSITYTV